MSLYILDSWSYQSLIENSAIYNTEHPILMDIVVYCLSGDVKIFFKWYSPVWIVARVIWHLSALFQTSIKWILKIAPMIYLFYPSSVTNTSINGFQILDNTRVSLEVDKISCLTVFSVSNPLFLKINGMKSPSSWFSDGIHESCLENISFGSLNVSNCSEIQDRSPEWVENNFPALILLDALFFCILATSVAT